MNTKLEKTNVVYHQESDTLCIAAQGDMGMVLHPVTESALMAFVAWTSRQRIFEPRLYLMLVRPWRWIKSQILRRPVCQGKYERLVNGKDGYMWVTVEHYAKEPIRIPFLKPENK